MNLMIFAETNRENRVNQNLTFHSLNILHYSVLTKGGDLIYKMEKLGSCSFLMSSCVIYCFICFIMYIFMYFIYVIYLSIIYLY